MISGTTSKPYRIYQQNLIFDDQFFCIHIASSCYKAKIFFQKVLFQQLLHTLLRIVILGDLNILDFHNEISSLSEYHPRYDFQLYKTALSTKFISSWVFKFAWRIHQVWVQRTVCLFKMEIQASLLYDHFQRSIILNIRIRRRVALWLDWIV